MGNPRKCRQKVALDTVRLCAVVFSCVRTREFSLLKYMLGFLSSFFRIILAENWATRISLAFFLPFSLSYMDEHLPSLSLWVAVAVKLSASLRLKLLALWFSNLTNVLNCEWERERERIVNCPPNSGLRFAGSLGGEFLATQKEKRRDRHL